MTFKFIPKDETAPTVADPEKNGFPPGKHWVDWNQQGTIAVLDQPAEQYCAVLGGIMAARMSYIGVKAIVVNGRVRDLAELSASGLHVSTFYTKMPASFYVVTDQYFSTKVWSKATSTVGTGAEAKAGLRNVPIDFNGVTVDTVS